MYVNLKIEVLKIIKIDLIISSSGKVMLKEEEGDDEKGTDTTIVKSK